MKTLIMILLVCSTVAAFGQQSDHQSEYYKRAAEVARDAARKTKCPERQQWCIRLAEWNEKMVEVLAGRLSSAGPQPTTPMPPCPGDMVGGGSVKGEKAPGSSPATAFPETDAASSSGLDATSGIQSLADAAQSLGDGVKFGIGGEYGSIPGGSIGTLFKHSLGVTGKLEIPLSKSLNFALSNTFQIFDTGERAQNKYGLETSYQFNTARLGLRFFPDEHGFFFDGDVGEAFSTSDTFKGGVAYAIGLGFVVGNIVLGGRYESWGSDSTITQIAAHLGIRF